MGYLQIFNLLKTLAVVVISVILAKFIKNQNLIAQWETLMLLSGGFTFFYVSGLGYTLLSFIKKHGIENSNLIFKNTFFLLATLGFLSCLAIVINELLNHTTQLRLNIVLIFCIYVFGNVCSSVLEYYYLLNKKYIKLTIWGVFNFLAFITAPLVIFLSKLDFESVIYSLALLGAVKFAVTLLVVKKPFSQYDFKYVLPLLKFNLPVILSLILGTGYVYIANFIVKAELSDGDFNLFRYGSREFPLFVVLTNSFSIILGSTSASDFSKSDFWIILSKTHRRLLLQVMPIAILLMIFSSQIFKVLFSEQFTVSYRIFNILLLTVIARVVFPQSLLMGRGITRYSFWASLGEFVSGILLSFLLIKHYGIEGIAWAIAIAFFIEKIILIIFCYKHNIEFHKSINFNWFLSLSLLLIISFIFSIYFNV